MYDRRVSDRVLDLAVSAVEGDALVLHDRQTSTRWSQLTGEALQGALAGERLRTVPSMLTTWGRWKDLHPGSSVFVQPRFRYRPRFTASGLRSLPGGGAAGEVGEDDLVVALEIEKTARAYLLASLREQRLLSDQVGAVPLAVYLAEDQATLRVFSRLVGRRSLTFELAGSNRIHDQETGSEWDPITLMAVNGPLKGETLAQLPASLVRWGAWKLLRPSAELMTGSAATGSN